MKNRPWNYHVLDEAEQIMGGLPDGVSISISPGGRKRPHSIRISREYTIESDMPDSAGDDPNILADTISANLDALNAVMRARLDAEPDHHPRGALTKEPPAPFTLKDVGHPVSEDDIRRAFASIAQHAPGIRLAAKILDRLEHDQDDTEADPTPPHGTERPQV
jgi:hypothetical protein